ncbi:MAG: hypothetical protein ACLFRX_00160 [Gemmatimonadota bacterium]
MRRFVLGALGVILTLSAVPTDLEAQGRRCRQVLQADARRLTIRGQEVFYFRDPVRVVCEGGVLLEADSAVMNRGAGTVELVGDVLYQDSTRSLRSEWANYLGRLDQLLARDEVVLEDHESGAVIQGDDLNYLRQSESRPVARMIVTGDRPYATIPPDTPTRHTAAPDTPAPDTAAPDTAAPDTAAPDTAGEPTEVWADRMELEGEDLFTALGDVEIQRGEITGAGDAARFRQAEQRMTLTGAAHVRDEMYRLDGERIDAFMEGGGLREVQSRGAARVTSDDLSVRSQQIRIGFTEGRLERLEAWNPDTTATRRARADARDFRLRADSIDARADSLGIRELRAVGRAYGERDLVQPADTVARAPLPAAAARDWIQGDTILGYFAHLPPEPETVETSDSVPALEARALPPPIEDEETGEAAREQEADSTRTVLERIVVLGGEGSALSLYRMAQDQDPGRLSINFMKAKRIILYMERGEVARVEAEGPIEGLYLEPSGRRSTEPPDSAVSAPNPEGRSGP